MIEVSTADRGGMCRAGGSGPVSVADLGDLKHRSASQARAAILQQQFVAGFVVLL